MNAGIPTLAQDLSHTSRSALGKHGNTSMTLSSDLPVFVYQCIEGHTIPPARGEVVDVDIWVPAKDRAQDSNRITKYRFMLLLNA